MSRVRVTIIRLNWASILFVSMFIAYGYYGALTYSPLTLSSWAMSAFIAAILAFYGWLAERESTRFADVISVSLEDLFVFVSMFLLLGAFSFWQLQYSLYSDEIAYSRTSHGQGLFVSMALSKYLNPIGDIPFMYLVQAVSFVFLILLACFVILSGKLKPKLKIAVFATLVVLCRLVFSISGGNASPHPPLQYIPPFVFGAIFGITDSIFKLSYFFSFSVFVFVLYRMLRRVLAFQLSYVAAIAAGTIPLLWHLGGVVEHALWAAICFSIVLTEIVTTSNPSYIRMVSIVSLATLMRQPSFLGIIPLLVLFVTDELRKGRVRELPRNLAITFSPVMLFVPFLGASLVTGTPTTDPIGDISIFDHMWQAASTDVIWTSVSGALQYWWLMLALFAFVPLSGKAIHKNLSITLFFLSVLFVYYSIHPSSWGGIKYQAEYAVPFAICGFLYIVIWASGIPIIMRTIGTIVICGIVVLNVVGYFEIQRNASAHVGIVRSGNILIAVPYNYREAYDYIKISGMQNSTYSIGPTYGTFPEVMNGYSIKDIRTISDIHARHDGKNLDSADGESSVADSVHGDKKIDSVIIGEVPDQNRLLNEFRLRGWGIAKEFRNAIYGTNLVLLRRSAPI